MTHRANSEPIRGTQAITRALRLLRAFTDDTPAWSLTRLAEASALNKSTTLRLLRALEQEGFVAREDGADRYRLGPEAIAVGARAARANPLRAAARPTLEALARETGETATLEVLVGANVLIVDEVAGSRLMSAGEIGVLYPAHATGTGKVLLAAAGAALPERLAALTPATIADPDRLRRELDAARANGFAWNREELERGFAAVGAPVRDGSGGVVAAVGLGGPSTRMMEAETAHAEAVVRAARQVSHRLGER
ncbi:MAG TPA: IclR family transcriptional regulator [Longimicrobiales bacterium]